MKTFKAKKVFLLTSLISCLSLNDVSATPVEDFLSVHPTRQEHKILSITENANVTGEFGGWSGEHMINGIGMFQG